MRRYYRTWPVEGGQQTHLEGGGGYSLCGMDVDGDPLIHSKPPEELESGKKHRVTCSDCQMIIEIVKDHLKKS